MKQIINKFAGLAMLTLPMTGFMACSDDYMAGLNIDETKSETIDPNAQLTTALLQPYGDFSLMDTYRSYIFAFNQHVGGSWNTTNYGGSVFANNDQMGLVWNQFYNVGIKNLVDGIHNTEDKPNINAALRIQRVYMTSILTDFYGDVPFSEAGVGYISGVSTPKYDSQEEIYNEFFKELDACIAQLGTGNDIITGDVTNYSGDIKKWKKYANTLRMRFAMRISDVNPQKAQEEFEKAVKADCGYIASAEDNAYVKFIDGPFTLYDGARDLDFRVNALGEVSYGQDPTSPTFICTTLYKQMQDTQDPRLQRIARHYLNVKRSEISPDELGNVDVTAEVMAFEASEEGQLKEGQWYSCNVGAAWYNNWVSCPSDLTKIPTLAKLVEVYPLAGYNENNCNNRMMRPFLSIRLEKPDCPGIIITSAETEFLLAEAKLLGWDVPGEVAEHYEAGIRASMAVLNNYYNLEYDEIGSITQAEIDAFVAANPLGANPKCDINTQAWILHLTNPAEAWSNLRRADYPVLWDRAQLERFDGFTYGDDLRTPVRLHYPNLESKYNSANYKAAIDKMGGSDDWHARVWWDKADIHYDLPAELKQ